MAAIDIRDHANEDITSIYFADARAMPVGYNGMSLELVPISNSVCIVDTDEDATHRIHKDDIDNLILALEKAKTILK